MSEIWPSSCNSDCASVKTKSTLLFIIEFNLYGKYVTNFLPQTSKQVKFCAPVLKCTIFCILNYFICPLLKIYSLFNTFFFSSSNTICFTGMKSNAAKIKFLSFFSLIHTFQWNLTKNFLIYDSCHKQGSFFMLSIWMVVPCSFKCLWPLFKCVGSKTIRKTHSFYTCLLIPFTEKNLTLSISLFNNCGESACFWKFKITHVITLDDSKKLGISDDWNEGSDIWYYRIYKTTGRFLGYSFTDG